MSKFDDYLEEDIRVGHYGKINGVSIYLKRWFVWAIVIGLIL